jgi:hypothetical protein
MEAHMQNEFVVGYQINGDGDSHDDMFIVDTIEEAKSSLIELINDNRDFIEETRASDDHWKRIDNFSFFIGTRQGPKVIPMIECGSRGEIVVNGVDMMFEFEHYIEDDFDFDKIIESLK